MDLATSAPVNARTATQSSEPSRQRPRGRPQRGRGRARGGQDPTLAFRPSTVAPQTAAVGANSGTETNDPQLGRGGDGRGRGRGRGRGSGRGGRPTDAPRTVNGRTFGGQLTQEATESTDGPGHLQGNARVFVPGQQHVSKTAQSQSTPNQPRSQRLQRRRMSKSQAPDIATRTHEDIDNGHYECAICTSEVLRNSRVWCCRTCWTVFHLKCIKEWSSTSSSSTAQEGLQDGNSTPRQWRCPGCNLPKDVFPKSYTCWCAKETDPRAPTGLPPHSCGQTCGRERVRKCPHPCQLTCHAGPCPPCTHMGPTKTCFCGKHESTKRCAETDYTSDWSCGEVCGNSRACGHSCDRLCHEGSCGPCEVRLPARCYCGQMEKDVLCSDQGEHKQSVQSHQTETEETIEESWMGVFECDNVCDRHFDCGLHKCKSTCHVQKSNPGHCPRSPDIVTHCPCGKTPLDALSEQPRQSCADPVPACSEPCGKALPCGHQCPQICHSGDCASCRQSVTINCRCGRTTSNTLCHQGQEESPQCRRVCRANLSCGRHMCDERCCSGERKAIERQANKKKQRPLGSAARPEDGFEAEHICTRQCGRPLKCGNHSCEELCHRGPCGSCREAIFDEISCHCGRTVTHPPLPCGTQPPACSRPCERPRACGHPQVAHNCHMDDQMCPKCPFLTEKRCMCGKKFLKNQQCWLRDVSCGEVCGKKLRCGVHFCQSRCHRQGECEDAGGLPCKQSCGKEKRICGHPDEALCHAPFPCKEERPCASHIFITCACQAQKQEAKCGASKSNEGNSGKTLPCNDECARLERNRKLALALNVDQSSHVEGGDHVPYSNETLNIFAQHTKWAQTQEREFRVFADSEDERRLRFKPMQAQQRAFIHSLAEDFGIDSESIDPEPHRHVMIWKTPRFVSPPSKTLADALRIRQRLQRSANVSANVSDTEGTMPVKAKLKTLDPYNSCRITKPQFGLTVDDVRMVVDNVLHASTPFTMDIAFLPNEDIILKAISRTLPPQDLEQMLNTLKMPLETAIAAKKYGTLQLCTTDSSLNITRYESDGTGGDGWSRVAAKKAAPRMNFQSTGLGTTTNTFAALTGGKVTFAKKKVEKAKVKAAPVAEDWEAAEMAEEERERVVSASEDDGGGTALTPEVATDDEGHGSQLTPAAPQMDAIEGKDWANEVEQGLYASENHP